MQPIQLNTRQHQLALEGETIEALTPVHPTPERLHESNTSDGTWRWNDPERLFDDLTIHHHLELSSPLNVGDVVYATEPWVITDWGEDGFRISYLIAPAESTDFIKPPDTPEGTGQTEHYWVEATEDMKAAGFTDHGDGEQGDWRDSDHKPVTRLHTLTAMRRRHQDSMPEWAARLRLRVTAVEAHQLTLIAPDGKEGEWEPQPWVWRITLQPLTEGEQA